MALDFTSAKQSVVAALQASRTPGASTVDGSNAQFASDTQIANAILYGDAEVCLAIINSPGHPYLPQFLVTSSGLLNGASLPAACGVPVNVLIRTNATDINFASTDVQTASDAITLSDPNNELQSGTLVQFTTAGTLPTPIVINTNYFVINPNVSGAVLVSGAGTTAVNGTFTVRGAFNGRPYYNLINQSDDTSNFAISWSGTQWVIWGNGSENDYGSTGADVAYPWLVSGWEIQEGDPSAPTVTESLITTFKFATTYANALAGIAINLTAVGAGNSTITFPYMEGIEGRNADEMTEVQQNPELFGSGANKYYKIDRDGNIIWTSAALAKVIYADFTLTSSPQAPSPYLNAVVAGALKQLYEDGGDVQLTVYYQGIFNQCLAMVRNQMAVIPAFEQRTEMSNAN